MTEPRLAVSPDSDFGVVVVFYDRKNRREVCSSQLVAARVVRHVIVCDDDDQQETGRRYDPDTGEPLTREQMLRAVEQHYDPRWTAEKLEAWPTWEVERTPTAPQSHEEVIGELAYKSEACPRHMNWDRFCMESDLLFLRCEARDAKVDRWRARRD